MEAAREMAHPAGDQGEGDDRMRLRGNVALLTVRRRICRERGAKVVLTDIRDELGEARGRYLCDPRDDRPSFKKAPADQLAHFAAAEESRSAAG